MNAKLYEKYALLALLFNILSYFMIFNVSNLIVFTFGIICILLMYYFIFKSSESLEYIKKATNRSGFIPTYIAYFFGLIFYIFIFSYNRYQFKEALAEFNQ